MIDNIIDYCKTSKLTVELPTHSCGRNGVKIGEILQNDQGENNLVPRCDPSQAGENCAWSSKKGTFLKVLKDGKEASSTNKEDYDFYIFDFNPKNQRN